jgi:phosphomannomutase
VRIYAEAFTLEEAKKLADEVAELVTQVNNQ